MSKGRSSKKTRDAAVAKWAGIVGNIPVSTTQTTPATDWNNIAFPLVKRVFAKTLGLDMVAVQPLSAPLGNLVYMDPVTNEIKIDPLVRIKEVLPEWRDGKDRHWEVLRLEDEIKDLLGKIFPGITDDLIEKALHEDEFMDRILKEQSLSGEYGI